MPQFSDTEQLPGARPSLGQREAEVTARESEVADREAEVARREKKAPEQSSPPAQEKKGVPGGEENERKTEGKKAQTGKEQKKGAGQKDGDQPATGEKREEGFRPSKKAIVIALIVILALLLAALFWWLHARQFVSTDDAYTSGHLHQVSARLGGTVVEVRVDDNQPVRVGDILVRLDPRDEEAALARARAALVQGQAQQAQAEAKIAQAKAQGAAAQAQVTQADAQVAEARAQLDRQRNDYDRIAGLYSRDIRAVSKQDVDAVTEAFERARSALDGTRANLLAAQSQVVAADANQQAAEAEAGVSAANVTAGQAQVRSAELQLSYCQIPAPVNGKISRKTVEEGQRIQPGQALMAVVPENVWVVANLKETQLERVQIGQRVDIKIDSLPHEKFFGTVNSIQEGSGATFSLLPPDNATGNFTKIVQRVPVKIIFDEESIRDFRDRIVPGLSVEPRIDLESLRDHGREPKRGRVEEKQNRKAESGK